MHFKNDSQKILPRKRIGTVGKKFGVKIFRSNKNFRPKIEVSAKKFYGVPKNKENRKIREIVKFGESGNSGNLWTEN